MIASIISGGRRRGRAAASAGHTRAFPFQVALQHFHCLEASTCRDRARVRGPISTDLVSNRGLPIAGGPVPPPVWNHLRARWLAPPVRSPGWQAQGQLLPALPLLVPEAVEYPLS